MANILGIDPGMNGGLALVSVINPAKVLGAIDIPTVGVDAKARVDVKAILRWLETYEVEIDHIVIERAQAMPRQGASSGFKYGRAVGALEAVMTLSDRPLTIVEASAWKKLAGLKGKTQYKNPNDAKEAARQRALQLFPDASETFSKKKDHGKAEAALIALYGFRLA